MTEQIMDQIASFITSGKLKPGERLSNERELAVQLGVTRGRVREALRALSLVGLITIKAGEGSFVSKMDTLPGETILWMFHNELHLLNEVYAARKLIESEVYMAAAQNIDQTQLDELELKVKAFAERSEIGEPVELLGMLDEIDLYVGDCCGNRIYAKLMQTIVHLRRDTSLKLLAVPGASRNGAEGRIRVLNAMKSSDLENTKASIDFLFSSSFEFLQSIGL